jgi:argininosuccinate synthase
MEIIPASSGGRDTSMILPWLMRHLGKWDKVQLQ